MLIREASNARNLRDLLPLVRGYGPDYTAFCTDDREPDELLREGHIDGMARVAVEEGVAPRTRSCWPRHHGAAATGSTDRGAIAPGYRADFMPARRPRVVRARGGLQGRPRGRRDGAVADFATPEVPIWVRQIVHRRAARPSGLASRSPAGRSA